MMSMRPLVLGLLMHATDCLLLRSGGALARSVLPRARTHTVRLGLLDGLQGLMNEPMRKRIEEDELKRGVRPARSGKGALDPNSPEARAAAAQARAELEAARREAAGSLEVEQAELAALMAASKSLEPCWTGARTECPPALKNNYTQSSLDFFQALRSPSEDPPAEALAAVRAKWQVLSARSDSELLALLQPIKDVPVDR